MLIIIKILAKQVKTSNYAYDNKNQIFKQTLLI